MPSKLMNIKEALEYARTHNLKGIKVKDGYLYYVNSIGKKKKVKIKPNLLIYHRGKGRWAVYSIERDLKIVSHKLNINVKNKTKWTHYGDIEPERVINKTKVVYAKVGRGKGIKKKIKRKIPSGKGTKSL
jgi:hypothetical protein